MAGYDPQSRRPRPSLPADSPVDDLLDVEELADEPVLSSEPEVGDQVPGEPAPRGLVGDGGDGEGLRPFEAPPIEMTDERADLLHRLGALAAVAALVAVLVLWRRRRREA
ncbi:MAG: hypothetical protein CL466_04640 [Acidimicrobiaceae bacterium]|mgnify:FL=1|nr:hypothetical protein [Acidimicrobiaceae bacterium]